MSVTLTTTPAQVGAFTLATGKRRVPDGLSAVITNDADWDLYILMGEGNPSASAYTYCLAQSWSQGASLRSPTLEIQNLSYEGPIRAVWLVPENWTSAGTAPDGQALITEFG